MSTVLLVIQVLLALGIIGLVLIQRSDSDGFGMGSGSGFGVLSGRAKANLLTRTTAILAGLFMLNSLILTVITANNSSSLLDKLPEAAPVAEKTVPAEGKETMPASQEAAPVTPAESTPVENSAAPAQNAPAEAPPEEKQAPEAKEEAPAPVVPRAE